MFQFWVDDIDVLTFMVRGELAAEDRRRDNHSNNRDDEDEAGEDHDTGWAGRD